MQEHSETQTYKHLLSVAENMLESLQTDPNIIQKYYSLKSALLSKASPAAPTQQLNHTRKLLNTYKYVTSSCLEIIAEFQAQIQTSMERSQFSRRVVAIAKEWELRLDEIKSAIQPLTPAVKLIAKEQLSALTYYCGELDSKFQNLGLFIEVHKKMQELIEQASKSQSQRGRRESNLQLTIQDLQREMGSMQQARNFVESHQLAEKDYKEFKLWSSKLSSLLLS